jgi:hypothetical protein
MGNTQLFLVRVWQNLSQFRASVRPVNNSEPRLFTDPEQVSQFLRRVSEEPTPTEAGDGNEGRAT